MISPRGIAIILTICMVVGCAAVPPVEEPVVVQEMPAAAPSDLLEAGFQNLAYQIVAGLHSQQASRIAVVQFQNLDGRVSKFGGLLAEEMITRLYQAGTFQVVEREMLNRVMDEHELATSGLVDESTAKELGMLLGVDAIATGTVTDLGSEVRVNSRLIATETGSVFSAAAVTLPKDPRITKLMNEILVVGGSTATMESAGAVHQSTGVGQDGDVFYVEDFSKVEEGLLPTGWIGGSTIAVRQSKGTRGKNCIANFSPGKHGFSVPNIEFPENWRFELRALRGAKRQPFVFRIGEIEIQTNKNNGRNMILNGITTDTPSPPANQEFLVVIEKNGDVVKLFLSAQKVHVVRMPNLEPPVGVSFAYTGNFEIYRMQGTVLK